MARPRIAVRDITPDDVEVVLRMWEELRESSGRGDRTVPPPSAETVLKAITDAEGDGEMRLVLATHDDEVVGMAAFTLQPLSVLLPARAVQVSYLHVRPDARRRGAGRALVAAAAAFAESIGADQVAVSVPPQLRDTNRFYARLGFAPLVTRRVVPLTALRRKLSSTERRTPAESLLYRRLSARSSVRAAMARVAERH